MFEEWPFKTHPVIKPSGTQQWLVTLNFISTNNVWQRSQGSTNDKQCNDTLYALVHSCYCRKPLRHTVVVLIQENKVSLKIKGLKDKNSWCDEVSTIDHEIKLALVNPCQFLILRLRILRLILRLRIHAISTKWSWSM